MSAKVIGDTKKIFRPGETSEEFHLPPLNSKMKSQQDRLGNENHLHHYHRSPLRPAHQTPLRGLLPFV
jgi:hypothetical protein